MNVTAAGSGSQRHDKSGQVGAARDDFLYVFKGAAFGRAGAAAAGARKRRSNPARTTAEITVGHLNRPAHGLAVGMRGF